MYRIPNRLEHRVCVLKHVMIPEAQLTDAAIFPERAVVWDLNYRGNLVFLDQARRQEASRKLQVEDGWTYFIYGWTRVIAEVFHVDIPTSGPDFDEICRIAAASSFAPWIVAVAWALI